MGIYLRWDITSNCSLNCIHCYNASIRHTLHDELTPEDIRNIINKFPSKLISAVKLMGGEPFDSELLHIACEELNRKRIPFGITTNGSFDMHKNIHIFQKEMFRYITFSMDGYEDQEARLFRRNLNVDRVLRNMKDIHMQFPTISLCLNLILNNQNYSKIYDILCFYSAMGMKKINISGLVGVNTIIENYKCKQSEMLIASEQIDKFITDKPDCIVECSFTCCGIYELLSTEKNKASFDYRCRAGREIGYIDTKGNLFPCEAIQNDPDKYNMLASTGDYSLLKDDFCSIWMKDAFSDVYNFDVWFRFSNEMGDIKCRDCRFRRDSCGKCFYKYKG